MAEAPPKVRLFVEADLGEGVAVAFDRDRANYLFNVMRLPAGATIALFNGRDGEWAAEIVEAGRRAGRGICRLRTREQETPPDVWLLFSPIKKARTDFIAEKAVEMGARRLVPVFTRFTSAERVKADRLRAHGIEAAEQCGITSVAEVADPVRLDAALDGWDPARRLLFCDEARDAPPASSAIRAAGAGPWAILVGPEGGFAPEERARLLAEPWTVPASLGPRVLRADTAAVAALALWQAAAGDWR